MHPNLPEKRMLFIKLNSFNHYNPINNRLLSSSRAPRASPAFRPAFEPICRCARQNCWSITSLCVVFCSKHQITSGKTMVPQRTRTHSYTRAQRRQKKQRCIVECRMRPKRVTATECTQNPIESMQSDSKSENTPIRPSEILVGMQNKSNADTHSPIHFLCGPFSRVPIGSVSDAFAFQKCAENVFSSVYIVHGSIYCVGGVRVFVGFFFHMRLTSIQCHGHKHSRHKANGSDNRDLGVLLLYGPLDSGSGIKIQRKPQSQVSVLGVTRRCREIMFG